MPDTIHGFKTIASFTTPAFGGHRAGRVILVDRGKQYDNHQRWVSSWQGDGDQEWSQGHYFDMFEDARDHFLERCRKERYDNLQPQTTTTRQAR